MEIKFLLDSNAVIDFLGSKLPENGLAFMKATVDEIPIISVISKIEILSFKENEEEYNLLQSFCGDAFVLDLNEES